MLELRSVMGFSLEDPLVIIGNRRCAQGKLGVVEEAGGSHTGLRFADDVIGGRRHHPALPVTSG